ncbi:hypothetical protein G6O69_31515 [Pseudenhygromyxa sp. WMMC2535]|uniref:hypothetical protein n=1 Tax=Pseudenhygromyxa sp. WMMC2535 TaxID=2712867 RepID=UPI0015950FE7|nr:hypothetical protein [Pseudenhygromyxa sp. WMMC2535]NVB42394.1 hypothetical protein [Pseudenhygromyxa sp. WMMC2535]
MRSFGLICVCALTIVGCSTGEADDSGNGSIFTTSTTATTGPGTSAGDTEEDDEEGEDDGSSDSADTSESSTTADDPLCGNGVKESGEECDGNDLGGLSCIDFGHDNGTLLCANDCTLFSNACSTCGDGQLAATEACDGNNFGGLTCTDLGYASGSLSCASDCSQVFEDGCEASVQCGNGLIDDGEACDGGNLNGETCLTQGFDGGSLSCSNCVFDTTACTIETCVSLLGSCNILLQDCCEGLTCGLLVCVPEE